METVKKTQQTSESGGLRIHYQSKIGNHSCSVLDPLMQQNKSAVRHLLQSQTHSSNLGEQFMFANSHLKTCQSQTRQRPISGCHGGPWPHTHHSNWPNTHRHTLTRFPLRKLKKRKKGNLLGGAVSLHLCIERQTQEIDKA